MANRKLKSLKFPGIDDTYILDAGNVNYSEEETYEEGSVGKGLNALKEDFDTYIFSSIDTITSHAGEAIRIVDGVLTKEANPSNYWKTLIVPIRNIYIDGVATLKTGGVSGSANTHVPSMVFIDEQYNVIGNPIYSAISPPATFLEENIPDGAVLVGFACESNFTFDFISLGVKVENISDEVEKIADVTTVQNLENIDLTFAAATGYYNKNGSFDTYSGVTTASVNVTPNEKYYLTAQNYYNAAVAVFFDSNNNYVSNVWVANNESAITNKKIIIPANASTMMLQRFYNYTPFGLKKDAGIKARPVNSILQNKMMSVIGDSITEKNFRAKTNWVLWITDWCGATIQNLGRSGTGFRAGYNNNNNYISRINNINSNANIIGVACSFNDISNESVNLGTITDTTSNDTVAGYANDFFDALITAHPTTPIICYVQNPWWAFHYGVARSDAWISLLSEICATRGIPFYSDMYKGSTLKPWILASREEYFTSDDSDGGNPGVVDDSHPNSNGHKVIARYLYPKFAENIVDVGLDYNN